jgi:prenyltransferase beta subunit
MNAVYWGLTALLIMGHGDALDRDEMIDFVMSCWDEEALLALILIMTRTCFLLSAQYKFC